jgi:hypothetical protein
MQVAQLFYPTWRASIRWGLGVAVTVVVLAVGYALIRDVPKAGEISRVTQAILLALMFGVSALAFTLIRRFPPVRVSSDGVFAYRGSGFRSRLVCWREISRVVPTSIYGFRFLMLIRNNPFPEVLRMPMHLDEISSIRDLVSSQAGSHHPLTLWLTEEHLPSNKSLERTRG